MQTNLVHNVYAQPGYFCGREIQQNQFLAYTSEGAWHSVSDLLREKKREQLKV